MKYPTDIKMRYNDETEIFIYNYKLFFGLDHYEADVVVMGIDIKHIKFEDYCSVDTVINECIKWCDKRLGEEE